MTTMNQGKQPEQQHNNDGAIRYLLRVLAAHDAAVAQQADDGFSSKNKRFVEI